MILHLKLLQVRQVCQAGLSTILREPVGVVLKVLYIQIQATVQEMFGVNSMRRAEHITMYIIIMQTQLSQVLVMHRAIHIVIIESMMSHLL